MQIFVITKEHLMLLKRAYICWNDIETGAPAIDPKRPYGNSSVDVDICEILGLDPDNEDNQEYALQIHSEMLHVLEIGLQTLSFKKGKYKRKDNYSPWKKA